jgi:hypothetical protein
LIRRSFRVAFVCVVVVVGLLVVVASASAIYNVIPSCSSGGTSGDCSTGWYTSPVQISWTWSPTSGAAAPGTCVPQAFADDTRTMASCSVSGPAGSGSGGQPINVEVSNPTASAFVSRSPDSNGWYNHPVAVSFAGTAFSRIASCTTPTTYGGPDTLSTTVAGTCVDSAGKVAGASVPVHYDATPPTISSALPTRPPDHKGWYNHPVTYAFSGTDTTSGVSGCSNITYAGPSSGSASVVGSCVDRAGNVARMAMPLKYDATGPALSVRSRTGDGFVGLAWKTSDAAPVTSIRVTRKPGLEGADSTVVYRGKAGAFRDRHVGNRRRYRYTVTATDQAGNKSVRVVHVTAGPHLISPGDGAHVSAPPLLRWTAVRHATYYNVQLFRGHKLMSTWPETTSFQLEPRWRFAGHHHRLLPGRYKWFVWPGFGQRSAGRYGHVIGSGTFVVTAAT